MMGQKEKKTIIFSMNDHENESNAFQNQLIPVVRVDFVHVLTALNYKLFLGFVTP